jgi:hypothetical protein
MAVSKGVAMLKGLDVNRFPEEVCEFSATNEGSSFHTDTTRIASTFLSI